MAEVIINALALGLSTGIYCLGACLPIMVPYLLSEDRKFSRNIFLIIEFSAGRFLAYILFGILAAYFGMNLQSIASRRIIAGGIVLLSFFVIAYSLYKNFPTLKVCSLINRYIPLSKLPFLLGFLIGVNICPPFLLAMAYLAQKADYAKAIVFFGVFFLATSLYIIPLIFAGAATKFERVQHVGRIAGLLAGGWFLIYGALILGDTFPH